MENPTLYEFEWDEEKAELNLKKPVLYSKLIPGTPLTAEEIKMLERAEKMPIVFDEDCPEPTPAQMAALMEARRRKPYHGTVPDDILAELDAKGSYGTEFEVRLRNELKQKAVAKEFAEVVKKPT